MAWGLAWIGAGRASGQFESAMLTWTAGVAASVVLLVAVIARLRRR
jgi:hypothetical protein